MINAVLKPSQESLFGADVSSIDLPEDILTLLREHRGHIFFPFGGGVNSVACYLMLMDIGLVPGRDFHAYYSDHGGDWPETRDYVWKYFSQRFPLSILVPAVEHFKDIYEYYLFKRLIPSRLRRDCTWKFKVNCSDNFLKMHSNYPLPVIRILGFDSAETHRGGVGIEENPNIKNIYPLREAGFVRDDCVKYIQSKGVKVPDKSACWFCPFTSKERWTELSEKHPDLFMKACILEEEANRGRKERGKFPLYLSGDMPLSEYIGDRTEYLSLLPRVRRPEDFERISNIIDGRFIQVFGIYAHLVHSDLLEQVRITTCKQFGFPYDPAFDEQDITFNISCPDREIRKFVTWALRHGPFKRDTEEALGQEKLPKMSPSGVIL